MKKIGIAKLGTLALFVCAGSIAGCSADGGRSPTSAAESSPDDGSNDAVSSFSGEDENIGVSNSGSASSPRMSSEQSASQHTSLTIRGVEYRDIVVGTGGEITSDTVRLKLNVEGRVLETGVVFDSSIPGNVGKVVDLALTPDFSTTVSREQNYETLIEGLKEGILGMRVGGLRKLIVPPELGYADEETELRPANSTLVYFVELIEVE
ncbi:MAG: FKBP-type peptidyl-prolyl cis-trans isomerase [Planctomycetes bacterium]|nr:FKBP-type peptidyl-prolyl cis-trans isomerase [Planctomycetota bacterium]